MIHVVASVHVKPGCRDRYLEILKGNVPAVKAESGCIEYRPSVDADAGLPNQQREADIVVILEKWESLDALHRHLATPHMAAYRQKVKELVNKVSLKVLQDA
jgi:quinol monooxygenase YgiN